MARETEWWCRVLGINFKKEQGAVKEYLTKVSANDLELVDKIVSSFENNESYTIGPLENGNSYVCDGRGWTMD